MDKTAFVRKMQVSDVNAVLEIEQASFCSEAWSYDSFITDIISERRLCLVLENAGKILGYMVLDILENEYDLLKIAIDIKHRKMGYATILMNYIKEYSINTCIEKISLLVRQSNLSAQALYKKMGFTEIVIRKHAYPDGENGIFMCTKA